MKGILPIALLQVVALASAAPGNAQWKDFLGAHLNHGRGCPACHVAHSPTYRNPDGSVSGGAMLWGEDVSSTYGPARFSDPGAFADSPERRGVLVCLSCHGGNYAPAAMMKNTIYEKLPFTFHASGSVPTFTEKSGVAPAREFGRHPIGLTARVGCGSVFAWDCIQSSNGVPRMNGPRSSEFGAHYGFFLEPRSYGNNSIVLCTTCHNPHSMNLTQVTRETASEIFPPGIYATKHFLRAPFDEGPRSRSSNLSAQFCRQCHADKSNEMNGSTAGTIP